jgi:hypothetical protein
MGKGKFTREQIEQSILNILREVDEDIAKDFEDEDSSEDWDFACRQMDNMVDGLVGELGIELE